MVKVPVSDALVARRMDAVRIFARYQHALDPATQIPPEAICNRRYRPKEPTCSARTRSARCWQPRTPCPHAFKAVTWRTLIGLLAATGMRPGEACRLTLDDIDLSNGVVQVLQTKFDKSRLVFIHPTTTRVLRPLPAGPSGLGRDHPRACPAVFVNSRREAINPDRLGVTFKQILAAAGITTAPGHRPPRLHDLRH